MATVPTRSLPDHPGMEFDGEKQLPLTPVGNEDDRKDRNSALSGGSQSQWWTSLVKELDVESRGIVPTRPNERTDPRYLKIFFIWLSANCNILS